MVNFRCGVEINLRRGESEQIMCFLHQISEFSDAKNDDEVIICVLRFSFGNMKEKFELFYLLLLVNCMIYSTCLCTEVWF